MHFMGVDWDFRENRGDEENRIPQFHILNTETRIASGTGINSDIRAIDLSDTPTFGSADGSPK
jgi:hypothetical protein